VFFRILGAVGGVTVLAAALASPLRAVERGDFAMPRRGSTLTAGSIVEVRWRAAGPDVRGDADEAELLLSLDGGRTFSVRVSSELPPGAASYRWRVPALAASSARLALRVGAGHERGRERIVLASGEFTIASSGAEPETLAAGPEEPWTEQALTESPIGDRLAGSLARGETRIVSPGAEMDADYRPPSPAAASLASRRAPERRGGIAAPASSRTPFRPTPTPSPLRL
jgi:hypothetical protein